jgi:acyl carrier protein
MSISTDLEQFILAELTQGREITSIAPDENLLTRGIVDSHGVIELVGFLEERYGIAVRDEDMTPENFESIASIETFVQGQRDGQS